MKTPIRKVKFAIEVETSFWEEGNPAEFKQWEKYIKRWVINHLKENCSFIPLGDNDVDSTRETKFKLK